MFQGFCIFTINLSILDFKYKVNVEGNTKVVTINLSILDFKYVVIKSRYALLDL